MIARLKEERQNLEAMIDNRRILAQARQAVAASKRHRGWQGAPGGKSRPTSTFMSKGKGHGKPKVKFQQPSS